MTPFADRCGMRGKYSIGIYLISYHHNKLKNNYSKRRKLSSVELSSKPFWLQIKMEGKTEKEGGKNNIILGGCSAGGMCSRGESTSLSNGTFLHLVPKNDGRNGADAVSKLR